MRLQIKKSKNAASLYIIKDITKDGKRTSKIVEKLGTLKDLSEKLGTQDPIEWAKEYIKNLNEENKLARSNCSCSLFIFQLLYRL